MPRIRVVIIAHNEGSYLRSTVESFRRTLPEGSEIVVVDDGSTDGGADFLTLPCAPVRLIRSPRNLGESRARNLGARHATGEILVNADAHLALPEGWWKPSMTQ